LAGALEFAKPADVFCDIRSFKRYDRIQKRDRVGNHRSYTLATCGRNGLKAGIRLGIELKCAADNVHKQRIVGRRAGEKGVARQCDAARFSALVWP